MIDPVVINFAVAGMAEVSKAFTTVEQSLRKFERAAEQDTARGSKARVRSTDSEVKAREKAYSKLVSQLERDEKRATKEAERQGKQRERDSERTTRAMARATQKLADTEIREAQRAARELERVEERKMRIRIRSSEMAGRLAAQEAAKELRIRERASGAWRARGRSVGGIVTGSVGGLVGGGMMMAGATLGIGGGMMLMDAGRKEMEAQKSAALLVNQVTTGKAPPPGATVGAIMGQASQVSTELGMDKNELIQGTLEYARKARGGDFKGAMANMSFFAKMSQTTGASIGDIAGAAGTLQSQNGDLDARGMQQMLLDVYAQGKQGSMSMVDVAKQLGTLASTRSSFQGNVAGNQRKLLALGQLAAPEGSIEEAGTYIKDITQAVAKPKNLGRLKAMGVKFDKFGAVESPENLIESVFRGTRGDMTKISSIFSARGTPLFRALEGDYTKAGGGEKGIEAVRAKMASVTQASMSTEQFESQHAQMMDTPAQKFTVAMNKMTEILEAKLGPVMERFAKDVLPDLVDKFAHVVDAAGDFAKWFMDNPIKGVGAIVLAAITKDLVTAGIGAAVKATLSSILSGLGGGTPSVAGGGGLGAVGKNLGAATAITATAVGLTELGIMGIDMVSDAAHKKSSAGLAKTSDAYNTATALANKANGGKVTAADIAKAQEEVTKLRAQQGEQKSELGGAKILAAMTGGLMDPSVNKAKGELKNTEMSLDKLQKAIDLATASLAKMGAQASITDPSNPGRNVNIAQRSVQ